MTDDVLGRVAEDLDVMKRAMGLRLPYGNGMLAFGLLMTLAAISFAMISLRIESDWVQQVPFAAIMVLVPVGLFMRSKRTSHEVNSQVLMSVTVYAVVWIAACGYMIATVVGPIMGTNRSTLLYASCVTFLLAFTLILVRAAVKSKENHYCLGLALSTLLAGMLLPLIGQDYSYSIAHALMAMGYLTGFAIQWNQLRKAATSDAAN